MFPVWLLCITCHGNALLHLSHQECDVRLQAMDPSVEYKDGEECEGRGKTWELDARGVVGDDPHVECVPAEHLTSDRHEMPVLSLLCHKILSLVRLCLKWPSYG